MCISVISYNAGSSCVGDNVVEPGDIENMDVGVEILFVAVLCAERVLLPVLGGRHIYFRYKLTSGDIIVEQLDLENVGMAMIASDSVKIKITSGVCTCTLPVRM